MIRGSLQLCLPVKIYKQCPLCFLCLQSVLLVGPAGLTCPYRKIIYGLKQRSLFQPKAVTCLNGHILKETVNRFWLYILTGHDWDWMQCLNAILKNNNKLLPIRNTKQILFLGTLTIGCAWVVLFIILGVLWWKHIVNLTRYESRVSLNQL